MNLDGIAGRALGQRLNGSRERKDRLAANDNVASAAKVAPGCVAQGETIGCDEGDTGAPIASHRRERCDTRQHVGGLD